MYLASRLGLLWSLLIVAGKSSNLVNETWVEECMGKAAIIGIDLTETMVTASIAYSSTNITAIAHVSTADFPSFAQNMAKHRLTAFLDTTRRTKLNKVQSGLQKSRGKAEASLPTVITRNRYFIVLWAYVERIYERYETPGPEQIIKGTTDELDYNGIIAATKTAALQNGVNITRAAFTIPSWLNSPHPLSIAAYNQSVHPTLDSPRRKIAAATAASIQSSDRILILEIDYWFLEMGTLMLDSNFKRLDGDTFPQHILTVQEFAPRVVDKLLTEKVIGRSGKNVSKVLFPQLVDKISQARYIVFLDELGIDDQDETKARGVRGKVRGGRQKAGEITEMQINMQMENGNVFDGVLLRSDCKEIDETFVEKISERLSSFLEALTLIKENNLVCGDKVPQDETRKPLQEVDAVLILSQNYQYGRLLERVTRSVLSGKVPVHGSYSTEDWDLASKGAALHHWNEEKRRCSRLYFIHEERKRRAQIAKLMQDRTEL